MPTHMLFMSFDEKNFFNLRNTLNRFFEYAFSLLEKKRNIHFSYLGTAANDRLIDRLFFSTFIYAKFRNSVHISRLLLTKESFSEAQIENYLTSQDILFIGGGNTEQMLKIWENKKFTTVLNNLKKQARLPLLAGVSAGGMYPFHSGLTDSTAGQYKPLSCLGWFTQSFCPHSDSKIKGLCAFDNNIRLERMLAYKLAVKSGHLPSGYAVPNDCMLHFYNDQFVCALSSHKKKMCSYVTPEKTEPIDTFCLTRDNLHQAVQNVLALLKSKEEIQIESELKQCANF